MVLRNFFGNNPDQLVKEALIDFQNGKDNFMVIQKLQKALKAGIRYYPLDQVHLHIGASYYDLGLYELAKDAYVKGLEYNAKNSLLLSNLGLAYWKLGRTEEALSYYRLSLEVDPNNSYAYHNIGFFFFENGKHFEAIEYLDRAIQINSTLNVAYAVKARCLAHLGRYQDADTMRKRAVGKGYGEGRDLRSELDVIKNSHPQIFFDPEKFEELLSQMTIQPERVEMIQAARRNPREFCRKHPAWLEDLGLTSFEISNGLPWLLLVDSLREANKLLTVVKLSEPDQVLSTLREVLSAHGFDAGDLLEEFTDVSLLDIERVIHSVASKLALLGSIELLNIWTSDEKLNIYPMDREAWRSLQYPFVDTKNGFGKVAPVATTRTFIQYLTEDR